MTAGRRRYRSTVGGTRRYRSMAGRHRYPPEKRPASIADTEQKGILSIIEVRLIGFEICILLEFKAIWIHEEILNVHDDMTVIVSP